MAKTYLYNVSEKLITERTSDNGSKYCSVVLPGICSFCVNVGQIFEATKRDGVTICPGKKTVMLGEEGTVLNVRFSRIAGANDYGNPIFGYTNGIMTVEDISRAWVESRKAFFNRLASSQASPEN